MVKRFTNLNSGISLSSHIKIGFSYMETYLGMETSISSGKRIKIVFSNTNPVLSSGCSFSKIYLYFSNIGSVPAFVLKNTNDDVIDIVDLVNGPSSNIIISGPYIIVCFDITKHVKECINNNSPITDLFLETLPYDCGSYSIFGFNYLNFRNSTFNQELLYFESIAIDESKGAETNYTEFDIGTSGTAKVSLFDGSLLFKTPLLVGNLAKEFLDLNLIYDSSTSQWKSAILFEYSKPDNETIVLKDASGQELVFELLDSEIKQALTNISNSNNVYYCFENSGYIAFIDQTSFRYYLKDNCKIIFSIINNRAYPLKVVTPDDKEFIYSYSEPFNDDVFLKTIQTQDDELTFSYDNYTLQSISSSSKDYETIFTYQNGLLTNITTNYKAIIPFTDGSLEVSPIRSTDLIYDSITHKLIQIDNKVEKRRLSFTYSNDKVISVSEEPFDEENTPYPSRDYSFEYSENSTKLITSSNKNLYYYFDNYKTVLYTIDVEGFVINYKYTNVTEFDTYKESHLISSITQSIYSLDNLLTNGSFEWNSVLEGWDISNNSDLSYEQINTSLFGDSCVLLENTSSDTINTISQTLIVRKNNTYILSGKYKIASTNVTGYTAKINLQYYETIIEYITSGDSSGVLIPMQSSVFRNITRNVSLDNLNDYWSDFTIDNLVLPDNANVTVSVEIPPNGKLYLDEFSFGCSNKLGSNNYVRNPSFEVVSNNVPFGWTFSNSNISAVSSTGEISLPIEEQLFSKNIIKIPYSTNIVRNVISQQIAIEGSSGEQISASIWMKGNLNSTESLKLNIKVHRLGTGNNAFEVYSISSLDNISSWQILSGSFVTSFAYDYMIFEIEYLGFREVLLDSAQLFKSSISNSCFYTERGELVGQSNGKASIENAINDNDEISLTIGKDNERLHYSYDGNSRKEDVFDGLGNNVHYEYMNNGVNKTLHSNYGDLVTSETSENGLYTKIDEFGNISKCVFNEFGLRVNSIDNNGNSVRRVYNPKFQLIEIERKDAFSTLGETTLEYNDLGKITKLSVSNGVIYTFTYDEWGRRTSGCINDVLIDELEYESPTDSDVTNPTSISVFSDDDYETSVTLEGDNPDRYLLNNSQKYAFCYDDFGRLTKYENVLTGQCGYVNYDASGLILSESVDDFSYYLNYDNLDNAQAEFIKISEKSVFNNINRTYEFNEIDISGFAFKAANEFGVDAIVGMSGPNGLFGLKKESGYSNVVYDDVLKTYVLSLNGDGQLTYNLSSVNKSIKRSSLKRVAIHPQYDLTANTKLSISGWFYFGSNMVGKRIITFLGNGEQEYYIQLTSANSLTILGPNCIDVFNLTSSIINRWVMITVYINGPESPSTNSMSIFIDKTDSRTVSFANGELNGLYKLLLCDPITHLAKPMKIAYMLVGSCEYDLNKVEKLYNSSSLVLFNELSNNRYECSSIYHSNQNDFDYISLDGTFISINNIKPFYSFAFDKSNGDPPFQWDEHDKRFVFAAFSNAYSFNSQARRVLFYDFRVHNNLSFKFDYKISSLGRITDNRALFSICKKDNFSPILSIYFLNSQAYLHVGGQTDSALVLSPAYDTWKTIKVEINGNSINIYDEANTLIVTAIQNTLDVSNTLVTIGCSSINGGTSPLNGYIKNIYYSTSGQSVASSSIDEYKYLSKYDSLGRKTDLWFGPIHKEFTYLTPKDENGVPIVGRTSTKLASEIDNLNNEILYEYDPNGNITKITRNSQETCFKYDLADRLIQSSTSSITKDYSYDSNGDILKIKTTVGENETNIVFTYDEQCGRRLLSISEGNNTVSFGYISQSLYPVSIGNMCLSWEGKLLKEINIGQDSYRYDYDFKNRRIKKRTLNAVTHYYYDNEKLVLERTGSTVVHYHYDVHSNPIGFSVSNNSGYTSYYYQKDEMGIIRGVLNSNNQLLVSYTYDDFGQLISLSGDSTLLSLNHILYKGYYYDYESGMYFLGHRYYYPYACRFVSPDDIEYLLSNIADYTQFNLYSYCNNNPIMFVDKDGHIIGLLIGLALMALGTAIVVATTAVTTTIIETIWFTGYIKNTFLLLNFAFSLSKTKNLFKAIKESLNNILNTLLIIVILIKFGKQTGFKEKIDLDDALLFNYSIKIREYLVKNIEWICYISSSIRNVLLSPANAQNLTNFGGFVGLLIGITVNVINYNILKSCYKHYRNNVLEWNDKINELLSIPPYKYPVDSNFAPITIRTDVDLNNAWVDNQGNVFWERIEIGCTNIMESGCGIMAAFNALRFSKEIPVAKFPDAILQLEKMNVMFEKTGALPSEIKQFIGDNGITITPLRTKNELINFLSNNQGNKAVVLTTINNEATLGLTIGENLKMHTFLLVKYLDNLISSYYAINGSSPFDLSDISENPLEENAFVYGIGIIKENNNE